ncbi:Crp/Fnr family transcriptional regulator [Moritella sp. 24]|uniref:Crp/Fnr family transcriptional regulator n=1 Tax=Moritella sp. 24 TaxID=2746230 RepID=UPI002105069A|nr:helix-turn-helix domain-containing protein [Moritella sp. 24]
MSNNTKCKLIDIAQYKTEFTDHRQMLSDGVCYIYQGTAAVCMQAKNLKTVNNVVMGKQEWFGDCQSVNNNLLFFSLSEIEPLNLIVFPQEQLDRLIDIDLEVTKWLYHVVNASQQKWRQSQLLLSENKQIKIIYLLIELTMHQKQIKGVLPKIAISQQQISIITGISRQRVNEALKQLESAQCLELERNSIYIIDFKGLCKRLDHIDLSIRDPRYLDTVELNTLSMV